MMGAHDEIEKVLGVSFRRKELLTLALVHSSYLNENPGTLPESNERLEYLGDAVIGMAVAAELYNRHPDWPEGRLTQARSALVQGESLAAVARHLDLGRGLLMGKGEAAGGGRERMTNLAAVMEAVVGALFLDQGYEAASRFVLRVLSKELSALARHGALRDAKSALQEFVQGRGLPPPAYVTVAISGEDHARVFTAEVSIEDRVAGSGSGPRKSQAEQEAAAAALRGMGEWRVPG